MSIYLSPNTHHSWIFFKGIGKMGEPPYLNLFLTHSVGMFFFGGGGWGRRSLPSYSMCSLSRKNIFSSIFHNNLNTCFVYTLPMELECTIYYLSPNAYSFIVSPHFLHAEYENPCLITWWAFFLSTDCANLI